jgi:hypothetical protein
MNKLKETFQRKSCRVTFKQTRIRLELGFPTPTLDAGTQYSVLYTEEEKPEEDKIRIFSDM